LKFLEQRDRQPELMDQPGLAAETHRHALNGLRTTNALCCVARVIWRGIVESCALPENRQPLRVLDVAAGGGDVLIGVAKLAARSGVSVEAYGCDINPTAVQYAQQAAESAGVFTATFSRLNALADPLPNCYDVVMSTLFLHHLSEADARDLLRRMAQAARQCVLIDDLRRNRLGYFYAWAGARLLTRSHIVHTDGPLSVRSAYTMAEMRQIANDAGLSNVQFRRHWPERFLMTWKHADA